MLNIITYDPSLQCVTLQQLYFCILGFEKGQTFVKLQQLQLVQPQMDILDWG